ncbi:MAG: sigma-70 family RNA polymerase sigma factor [Anaerolineae bacterium]|nr:sigma-70 family RNA polymerase sigma factor [Anaerolineae bacterium]
MRSAHEDGARRLWDEAGRSRQWFGALYLELAPLLYRYFWFQVRTQAEAEDLVSETFVRALRSLPSYRAERGSIGTWLFGIARHALASHRRAERWARHFWANARQELQVGSVAAPPPEESIDLRQAVSELSQSARELIGLKFGAGLSYREIAEIMRLSEANVGVQLYRALVHLRDRLEGEGGAR